MPSFVDQLGRTLTLHRSPLRIISLVPSQTELLHTLGLDKEVVGITKFCIRPASWFREKTRVGGTKDIHPERIEALRPDLIIANKEENDRSQVEALASRYPVWISDVKTLPDALDMIGSVGNLIGRPELAATLIREIRSGFDSLAISTPQKPTTLPKTLSPTSPDPAAPPLRTAYFIWQTTAPLTFMAAGGDTFIHDMLTRCHLTNIFADKTRYPTIDPQTLTTLDPQLILLSSEPYPFREKHLAAIQTLFPHTIIRLVDGERFSWYGSRLLHAPAYFSQLLASL